VQTYDKLFKRVLQQDRMVALLSAHICTLHDVWARGWN